MQWIASMRHDIDIHVVLSAFRVRISFNRFRCGRKSWTTLVTLFLESSAHTTTLERTSKGTCRLSLKYESLTAVTIHCIMIPESN